MEFGQEKRLDAFHCGTRIQLLRDIGLDKSCTSFHKQDAAFVKVLAGEGSSECMVITGYLLFRRLENNTAAV